MIIGVNCGHTASGQPGCGALGYIDESVETRRVGNALMELLKKGGHTVVNCTNDYAISTSANLNKITELANAQYLDLFVSIHFNAGGGRGTEVYTYGGKVFDAASNTVKGIATLGFNNRGIKDGSHLAVLRRTDARAMLVEVCFVDTEDAQKYISFGRDKIAQAIYKGITGSESPIVTRTSGGDVTEYTSANDIIWELHHRGVITNKALWVEYCSNDTNVYYFLRKLCQYIRTKARVENEKNEYTKIRDIVWDLGYRGIISNADLWTILMERDSNIHSLLQKSLHYCRTH